MAFILALLKTGLDFSQDRMEENGTLETQGFNSTEIKITHPPFGGSENSFSRDIARTPIPRVTDGGILPETLRLVAICHGPSSGALQNFQFQHFQRQVDKFLKILIIVQNLACFFLGSQVSWAIVRKGVEQW